jgi:hypothetical protein
VISLALSGTATLALSGTRISPHQEPAQALTPCHCTGNRTPSNCNNLESYGFLLTGGTFRELLRPLATAFCIVTEHVIMIFTLYYDNPAVVGFPQSVDWSR